jgi:hypothetical protein
MRHDRPELRIRGTSFDIRSYLRGKLQRKQKRTKMRQRGRDACHAALADDHAGETAAGAARLKPRTI